MLAWTGCPREIYIYIYIWLIRYKNLTVVSQDSSAAVLQRWYSAGVWLAITNGVLPVAVIKSTRDALHFLLKCFRVRDVRDLAAPLVRYCTADTLQPTSRKRKRATVLLQAVSDTSMGGGVKA